MNEATIDQNNEPTSQSYALTRCKQTHVAFILSHDGFMRMKYVCIGTVSSLTWHLSKQGERGTACVCMQLSFSSFICCLLTANKGGNYRYTYRSTLLLSVKVMALYAQWQCNPIPPNICLYNLSIRDISLATGGGSNMIVGGITKF